MMDKLLEQRQLVARRVAQPFAAHPKVVSVIVFGSVATGTVDEDSDVDMLVFCHPHLIPAVERHKILQEVGSGWALSEITGSNLFAVADEGGIVDGIPVTVHYQLASWIESVLSAVLEQGAITTEL